LADQRQKIIAGNWKLNCTVPETERLLVELLANKSVGESVTVVVCPPYPSLSIASKLLQGSQLALGAQDMSAHERGAYTGEVSGEMLLTVGVQFVILGHYERRQYHAETNALVSAKAKLALPLGLVPIICIGETLSEREAAAQKPGDHGLLALDWWNGNRSVLVDANLSGLLIGMTLATRAPDIYRALIEATAYGTRVIVENFERCGVPVRELVIAGGLQKNKLLMQIYADVTGRPLSLVDSEQGPALGSAMHAAVAAGLYPTIADAAARMGRIRRNVYTPDPATARAYDGLYADYVVLHDYFGRGTNDVMKRLKGAGASR
jgi:hypothetical protein